MDHDTQPTKKGILPFVTAWTELEGISLRERRQTRKDDDGRIPLPDGL